jgi:predicted ATPase
MRAGQKTFAEEFERVLVESDTSVRRLARLTGISRRTMENWLYRHSTGPRYVEPVLEIARVLQLPAVDTDRLLLSAGHPSLTRLRQKKQLQPDILLEWQLPPDTQKGQKHSALDHAQQLLRQMPWNEEAHREVMELLALNGRRSEALKQFEICKQTLRDELGVDPSAETLALYERIKRTAHFSKDNIPAIVTPLIGREAELEKLLKMLADPDVRLVTITGLGGTGKTRLALDIAWRHTQGQFSDGVTFVQLAALDSADLLVPAIARALHLPLQAADEEAAREELLDFLKPKQLLLVLDNCEHLLDGMTLVADILMAAPRVQILATSRERLRLRAEYVFPLPGLPYDDRPIHPAAELFQGTVQRIEPEFSITELNSPDINRLCRLVDGIPLALELAAGALDQTSVTALADEIEQSLDTLFSDFRDVPARHRSLRAVLESTWARLQPQTRQVFAALSVFRGSFSPDAALKVASAAPELLEQLMAHSLLEFDREADRYRLHEMLRQFAAEKLTGNPELEQAADQRHFVYYNDLGQRGGEAMRGGDQVQWSARLELEENNIRQAIDWAVNNDIESVTRLVVSLHTYWYRKGRYLEGAQQYERLMPYQEQLSPDLRPWLVAVYAKMILMLGRTQESVALTSKALPLFWQGGDDAGAAYVYTNLSSIALLIGENIASPVQLAEAGLQHALAPGADSHYASLLLITLGEALAHSGRHDEAGAWMEQGLQLCKQRNDQWTANLTQTLMTILAIMQGQYAEAHRLAEQCLNMSRQLGMLRTEIMTLNSLGLIAYAEGDLDLAQHYFADDLTLTREANWPYTVGVLASNMSDVLMAKGAYSEALVFLREATSIAQDFGGQHFLGECIERLALWAWRANAWIDNKFGLKPVRWLACATAVIERSGHDREPYYQPRFNAFKKEMEANLGEEAFAQAWAAGVKMSVEEALDEILPILAQETS